MRGVEPLLLRAEKMPPRGEVLGQTWDTLERLYLVPGLGTPEKLVEVAGEGNVWVSLQLEVSCVLNHPIPSPGHSTVCEPFHRNVQK